VAERCTICSSRPSYFVLGSIQTEIGNICNGKELMDVSLP